MNAKDRIALQKVANKFLQAIKERVDTYVLLGQVDELGRLVEQVEILGEFEIIHALKEKGLSKDITALCDKVGK